MGRAPYSADTTDSSLAIYGGMRERADDHGLSAPVVRQQHCESGYAWNGHATSGGRHASSLRDVAT